jgi:hypothetical protein
LGGLAQPTALPKSSPFLPAAAAGAPAAAANETLELAGVSSIGKRTDLIFHNKTTKKNHWVGLGESKDGISVVSFDARREQAVIKFNGVDKVLTLRKGTGPVNAPGPAAPPLPGFGAIPAPVALPPATQAAVATPPPDQPPPALAPKPAPPTVPEAQLRQETEARMLVSDLLEIGMAQRKAYEEAQRRAAEGNPPATPPADTSRQP